MCFKDDDVIVGAAIASNPATSADHLRLLAIDDGRCVRFRTSGNYHAPADALACLATNPDWAIRAGVAVHLNTSMECLMNFLHRVPKSQRVS